MKAELRNADCGVRNAIRLTRDERKALGLIRGNGSDIWSPVMAAILRDLKARHAGLLEILAPVADSHYKPFFTAIITPEGELAYRRACSRGRKGGAS